MPEKNSNRTQKSIHLCIYIFIYRSALPGLHQKNRPLHIFTHRILYEQQTVLNKKRCILTEMYHFQWPSDEINVEIYFKKRVFPVMYWCVVSAMPARNHFMYFVFHCTRYVINLLTGKYIRVDERKTVYGRDLNLSSFGSREGEESVHVIFPLRNWKKR